jgi:hypothetical protein
MRYMTPVSSVRDAVRDADRRRRSRDGLRQLAQLAPIAAGITLIAAAAGRIAGWPVTRSLLVFVLLAGGLAALYLVRRRSRPATDALAATIDADAGLAGELRSAHWFESNDARDAWTEFHLEQARRRVGAVSWSELYPRVRAARAWIATAALTAGAIALMITVPRTQSPIDPELAAEIAAVADQLPPDLQKRLDELLTAVKAGEPGAAEASEATLAELKELLAKLDPELQRKLADLAQQLREKDFKNADEGDQRAGSDDPDSNAGMPEDIRWAAEDLAARLANANLDRKTAEQNPAASSETGEKGPGSPQAENAPGQANQDGMQMMRQAASDPGASQLMMAAVGAMGGDSSSGAGGNQANNCGPGSDPAQCPQEFASIAQALRKELIEASADMMGENIKKTEDLRRKTEQGTSSLGFTRIAPPATLERSRAASPPAVPDARRPLLFNYFIRPR